MNLNDTSANFDDPVGIFIINLSYLDEVLDKMIKTPMTLRKYNSEDLLNSTFKNDLSNNMYPTPVKPLSTKSKRSTPSIQYKSISRLFEYIVDFYIYIYIVKKIL